ncbi:MAG: glycosyltransferase family 2 protein [Chloroflexi bacterium]|nr:glycosyltransferase family 2 protein [Chloroflexota bacterium]
MPTYNRARFVTQAIESVLAQTYPNWDLLIGDDASSDDTATVLEGAARRDARVHCYCSPSECWLPCQLYLRLHPYQR